jgi:hypothetical protein
VGVTVAVGTIAGIVADATTDATTDATAVLYLSLCSLFSVLCI